MKRPAPGREFVEELARRRRLAITRRGAYKRRSRRQCTGFSYPYRIKETPHQPDWIYKIFAYSLGLDCDIGEKLKTIPVEHNGYRFRFATYNDQLLRDIQFYLIESELEQAVGRARLLRMNCTINLFSNFPLRQANLKKSEYDNGLQEAA